MRRSLNSKSYYNNPYYVKQKFTGYGFSKSPRFRAYKSNCQMAYYDYNTSQLTNLHTKFGTGMRSDFTRPKSVAPPPTKYNIPTCFEIEKEKQVGKTFGLSRDNLKEGGHILQGVLRNPSPQAYNPRSYYSKIAYTMKKKNNNQWLPNFLQAEFDTGVPGPGFYKDVTKSKVKNIAGYSKQKEERFFEIRPRTPGPADYNIPNMTSEPASTKYKKGLYISKASRTSFVDDVAQKKRYSPGPGNYKVYTDFGDFDATPIDRMRSHTSNA